MIFRAQETEYELKFDPKRVKLIEHELGGESLMTAVYGKNRDGLMSLTALDAFFQYGTKEAGADAFLPPKKASAVGEAYLTENGYMQAVQLITQALADDMGFLFRLG